MHLFYHGLLLHQIILYLKGNLLGQCENSSSVPSDNLTSVTTLRNDHVKQGLKLLKNRLQFSRYTDSGWQFVCTLMKYSYFYSDFNFLLVLLHFVVLNGTNFLYL